MRSFARAIDASLSRGNDDYRAHREGDRQLLPPVVRIVPPGAFAAWMERGRRHVPLPKVPRVIHRGEAEGLLGEGTLPKASR